MKTPAAFRADSAMEFSVSLPRKGDPAGPVFTANGLFFNVRWRANKKMIILDGIEKIQFIQSLLDAGGFSGDADIPRWGNGRQYRRVSGHKSSREVYFSGSIEITASSDCPSGT